MAAITVELIKTLRDKTNAGMMDCKSALTEANGDIAEAETILRKKGIADAEKKSGRTAKEGVIASRIDDQAKTGILVEVNCETDFVAKNENFRAFVESILDHITASPDAKDLESLLAQPFSGDNAQTLDLFIKSKVGELGEKMGLTRFEKYQRSKDGVVASYIHMQGRIGVLTEVNCGKTDTAKNEKFRAFVKDLTLHIAAAHPICMSREQVPTAKVEAERDVFREQMKDKPADKIEKIIDGKLGKFYSTMCLLEQPSIKDDKQTIQDLVTALSKELGDTISIARFARYAVGEEVAGTEA